MTVSRPSGTLRTRPRGRSGSAVIPSVLKTREIPMQTCTRTFAARPTNRCERFHAPADEEVVYGEVAAHGWRWLPGDPSYDHRTPAPRRARRLAHHRRYQLRPQPPRASLGGARGGASMATARSRHYPGDRPAAPRVVARGVGSCRLFDSEVRAHPSRGGQRRVLLRGRTCLSALGRGHCRPRGISDARADGATAWGPRGSVRWLSTVPRNRTSCRSPSP